MKADILRFHRSKLQIFIYSCITFLGTQHSDAQLLTAQDPEIGSAACNAQIRNEIETAESRGRAISEFVIAEGPGFKIFLEGVHESCSLLCQDSKAPEKADEKDFCIGS